MTFGILRLQGDSLSRRLDALVEARAPLGFRRMSAEPVIGARELPGGVEARGIAREVGSPQLRRGPRIAKVRAVRVQRVSLADARNARRRVRRLRRWRRQSRDIE